jgi:lysophospholipase L1-like esterase
MGSRYVLPRVLERFGPEQTGREPITRAGRKRQFRKNMRDFRGLISKVRAEGALPIVLLMPGLAEILPQDGELFTRYAPYRDQFRRVVDRLGVALLDMSTVWTRDPDLPRYFADGTHLTVEGNRAVATAIVRTIGPAVNDRDG